MPATPGVSRELVARYDVAGPRYTSYPTVPAWTAPFGPADYQAALRDVAERPDEALSLYVHLPFCASRCHYCGCNALVTRRNEVADAYLDRLERELGMVLETLGRGREVVQMHWGGGTPNFLTCPQLERLARMLERAFAFAPDAERSIELDPRLVTPGQLPLLRQLGFTRVSLGVQDLDPAVQFAIGRVQSLGLVADVVGEVRRLDFESLNLDLIYGLPLQTPERFRLMLDTAQRLRPDRIAVFGYAHMPEHRHHQRQIQASDLPTGAARFDLFVAAVETFTEAGYQWIGLDHFATPSDAMAVAAREHRLHRNFMGYTVQPAPHLLALGMSAIGDLAGRLVQLDAKLGDYQKRIDAGELPVARGHHLSADDRRRRSAILHLICNLELPYDLPLDGGGTPRTILAEELVRLARHARHGLVTLEPARIAVAPAGRFFLRNLCMELDAHLERARGNAVFSRTV